MKAIEKLRSESGASIIIALVLFLVATMVSVTIMSTSLTAVKRVHDDKQEQQEYLALQSASKVIKSILDESTCKVTDGTRYDEPIYEAGEGLFAEDMNWAIEFLDTFYSGFEGKATDPITITVTPEKIGGKTVVEPVKLVLVISKNSDADNFYSAQGRVTFMENGSRELKFSGQIIGDLHTEPDVWSEPLYDGDGNPVLDEDNNQVYTTCTGIIYITEYNWENIYFTSIEPISSGE